MAQVTLQRLAKVYPEKNGPGLKVVHDIDLEIRDGEFMVLVGPSGCGKSTTLRMIAGLEDISGGEIRIGDRVVNHVLPKDRDIAMVFQNYALYPHMSVYDNMAFGLKLRKLPRAEIDARVREAARMLGLENLLERLPKALSGGQRQRVAVGRAIVRQPQVFLFDEPLSNLDAKMRVSMRTEISRLHAQIGATMIYVTHDQVEAMTMGDRICVMRDGRIMQVASPLELYNRPANLFVAGFIGSPPMNFLRGKLIGDDFVENHPQQAGRKIRVPEALVRSAARRGGREVVLGIRPENLRLTKEPGDYAFATTVEIAEPMGAETLLHVTTGVHSLIARVHPTEIHSHGARVLLAAEPSGIHLFDANTEEAIV